MMMMMMVLCSKAGSLAFMTPRDVMNEVVSHCHPHRQLWASNLSNVATQRCEVHSNQHPVTRHRTYHYTITPPRPTRWVMEAVADPDIWLRAATSCGGSTDIRLCNLICFPVSHVISSLEGPNTVTKLHGEGPWICHCMEVKHDIAVTDDNELNMSQM